MASKRSPTETQPTAPKRSRARKKPPMESPPVAPATRPIPLEAQGMTPAQPVPPWFTPVAIGLAVLLLVGILLEINRPLELAVAGERLAWMEAGVGSGGGPAELASAERIARTCREGLRSLVRMWNQYVAELKASEASPKRYRAARRRFDIAQEQASQAVRRCDDA
jgi:hypothetical protein